MTPIKLVVFDIDDTLWYSVDDAEAVYRFEPISERRVADHVGHAQELVPNARKVLRILKEKGYEIGIGTMGPEDQVKSFMKGFGIENFFDFSISAFDREDKDLKILKILEAAQEKMTIEPKEIVFIDDNLGYLQAVNSRFPDVKCIWAHYRMEPGLCMLNEDMEEMHGFSLW